MNRKVREFAEDTLAGTGYTFQDIMDVIPELPSPHELTGVTEACMLLADIIMDQDGFIVLNRDYDLDGIVSGAINETMLVHGMGVPFKRIKHIQNKRNLGNGFNDHAVGLLKHFDGGRGFVDVLITSDHGSHDEVRYEDIRKTIGCRMIITDHHLLHPDGPPKHVDAFVNPMNCDRGVYKDISGGVTTYLLMWATAMELEKRGWTRVDWDAIRDVEPMLALTTLCDQMTMLCPVNRKIVKSGLEVMNSSIDARWVTIRKFLKSSQVTDTQLSFKIGPMTNATGRLNVPILGYDFFVHHGSEAGAMEKLMIMDKCNNERKVFQNKTYSGVRNKVMTLMDSDIDTDNALVIYIYPEVDMDGNEVDFTSISGPMASKVVEEFQRSAIVVSDVDGKLKGSCRAVKGVHIKDCLDRVNEKLPTALIKYGGHSGAAGVEIDVEQLDDFRNALDAETIPSFFKDDLVIVVDDNELDMDFIQDIEDLGPFGNNWKQPSVILDTEVKSSFQIVKGTMTIVNLVGGRNGLMMVGKDYKMPKGPTTIKCRVNITHGVNKDSSSMFIEEMGIV